MPDSFDQLTMLERLSDNPSIKALVKKARMVKIVKDQYCVNVFTSDRVWEVRRTRDNEVYCTCPAYRFNKENPRNCKHTLAVSALMTIDEIPVYIPKRLRDTGQ